MSNLKAVRPEDIMPDSQNSVTISGTQIRKGSMAALIRNLDVIESKETTESEKKKALTIIQELAPTLQQFGLVKHFTCKNKQVRAILES